MSSETSASRIPSSTRDRNSFIASILMSTMPSACAWLITSILSPCLRPRSLRASAGITICPRSPTVAVPQKRFSTLSFFFFKPSTCLIISIISYKSYSTYWYDSYDNTYLAGCQYSIVNIIERRWTLDSLAVGLV